MKLSFMDKKNLNKPLDNKIAYPLLVLVAALSLLIIHHCLLGSASSPLPGYAVGEAKLYFYPSEVAVDLGETVTLELRLDTNSYEISALDVALVPDPGLVITEIEPSYVHFATFAPIDENGVFDELAAISANAFGAVQYDNNAGIILPEVVGNSLVVATVTFRADTTGSLYVSIDKENGSSGKSGVFVSNFLKSMDVLDSEPETARILSNCVPNCSGKECGNDGCLGTCGTCDENEVCMNGTCRKRSIKEEKGRGLF